MAEERYRTNGSAAYDIYSPRFDGNAALRPKPAALPEETHVPQTETHVRPRFRVAPFALVGFLVVTALLAMVVYGYVRLYEATSEVGELNAQLTSAQRESAKLRSTYESRIDLTKIEQQAKALGMRKPTVKQTVYLNVAGADHTEVLQVDERGFFAKALDAVGDSFRGILEYFK